MSKHLQLKALFTLIILNFGLSWAMNPENDNHVHRQLAHVIMNARNQQNARAAQNEANEDAEELPRMNQNYRIPESFVEFNEEDLQALRLITKNAVLLTLAQTAAKHIGKLNDPSNTFQSKLADTFQQAAITFIITEGIPLTCYFGYSAAQKIFYNLPFEYCRKKKAELEHQNALQKMKLQEAIDGNTKNKLQDILAKDANLLKANKKNLANIKQQIDEESNETKKEQLSEIYQTLKSQHIQAQIQHSNLLNMSISNFQPYATTVILETMKAHQETNRS
ncbi:MAG: hypothetical protein AMXMBFR12_05910 [Candidatus Babeliales bacterium]